MNRKVPFAINEYYHLYNRGTDKRKIFSDQADYRRFMRLLYLCNTTKPTIVRDISIGGTYVFDRGETLVDIGAYCLMPNHFHLLIRAKNDNGVTNFMKKISTGYSMYFNIKNKRSGGLFEGIFKSQHVDSDEYLKYLFAYIHLNPVKIIDSKWKEEGLKDKVKAENFLLGYHYSSYQDYLKKIRPEKAIINESVFPDYFEQVSDFNFYLNDWLTYHTDTEVEPM